MHIYKKNIRQEREITEKTRDETKVFTQQQKTTTEGGNELQSLVPSIQICYYPGSFHIALTINDRFIITYYLCHTVLGQGIGTRY